MTETHIIKLPQRTGVCEITERADRIIIKLRFDKVGTQFNDLAETMAWLAPLCDRYDKDPRPIVMDNPNSGEIAIIP
jgi:hypothetical protein